MRLNEKQKTALSSIAMATAKGQSYNASSEKRRWPSMAPAISSCRALVKKGLVTEFENNGNGDRYFTAIIKPSKFGETINEYFARINIQ